MNNWDGTMEYERDDEESLACIRRFFLHVNVYKQTQSILENFVVRCLGDGL